MRPYSGVFALGDHAQRTAGPQPNWRNAPIVTTEKDPRTRLRLESSIVQTTGNIMNWFIWYYQSRVFPN